MTVCADSEELEVYSACRPDSLSVTLALCVAVLGISVKEVDVLFLYVNIIEEIFVHKCVVAVLVVLIKIAVFVKVECGNVLEADFAVLVKLDELLVCRNGGSSRCKAENRTRIAVYKLLIKLSGGTADLFGVVVNFNVHCFNFLRLNVTSLPESDDL